MDDVHGYEKLRELIELEFPYLDDNGIGKVYSSVLECMNFKDHVSKFFFQKAIIFWAVVFGKKIINGLQR